MSKSFLFIDTLSFVYTRISRSRIPGSVTVSAKRKFGDSQGYRIGEVTRLYDYMKVLYMFILAVVPLDS